MISASLGRAMAARHASMAGSLRLAARTASRVNKTASLSAARAALLLRAEGPAGVAAPVRSFYSSRIVLAATKKATATKKKPATAARGKKAPAKKAKKKAATKKKAAAPKKKKTTAKKKAAPRKRKALTDTQKEARKEKLAKSKRLARIRELRKKALLNEEPRSGNGSAWTAFVSEIKAKNKTVSFQELSSQFKALNEADAEKYRNEAKKMDEARISAFNEWIKSLSPAQIKEANIARAALKRMGMRSRHTLQDSRLPKRPRTAYVLYAQEKMKARPTDVAIVQYMSRLASEWRALSAAQKKPYEDLGTEDKKRYERECKAAFGS